MEVFQFKKFQLKQSASVFKLTTDATLLASLGTSISKEEEAKVLDVGTGTGIIPLMLAQLYPKILITGIDINPEAVRLAKDNFISSSFANRLEGIHHDIMEWESEQEFQYIVCNPPYFLNDTVSHDSVQAQSRHLIGFNYDQLVMKMKSLLSNKGEVSLIFPCRYENTILESFRKHGFTAIHKIYIRHNKKASPKNMIFISKINKEEMLLNKFCVNESYFDIRNEEGDFSDEYQKVLKDFLTIF